MLNGAAPLTVAVIGAGTMGSGIAQSVIVAEHTAILIDNNSAPLARARAAIESSLARAVERGSLAAAESAAALARLVPSADLASAAAASVVIEAVYEDAELKRRLFAGLAPHLAANAIVATNTSAIRLDALADAVPNAARFVGLHYFFPAASNQLLEVVRGSATSDATFARAHEFATATNKVALACRDSNGFVVNRFFAPWLNEAVRLDDEGVPRAVIERAGINAFGAPMGPFALMVATKTEIALHATAQLSALGPFYASAAGLARLVATGTEWVVPPRSAEASPADAAALERLRGAVWFALGQLFDEAVCDAAAVELGAGIGLRWSTGPIAAFRADRARGADAVAAIAARYGECVPASLATL